MNNRLCIPVYVLAGLLLLAPGFSIAEEKSAEQGRAVYMTYGCYQCHGTEGQGAITGPRLAPGPLPFAAFRQFVRYPVNRMPPYPPGELSETDLKAMHAYLASLPPVMEVDDIPLLSERGREIAGD